MKDLKKGNNPVIVFSYDPGYDGSKGTINGDRFSIPKKTVKKIGNEYESVGSLEGVYEIETEKGTYLCGPNIMILVDDNEDFHKRFDRGAEQSGNFSYFATNEFEANALASVAIALIKAEKEGLIKAKELDKVDLYFVIELPHDALESMAKTVAGMLVGEKTFTFKGNVDGEDVEQQFNISIRNEGDHFIVMSQVIACLFGYITDEDGYEIEELKDEYPAVVVDGGYYTVGDFTISKTKAISGAESKTEFGMMRIHEITAERINKECGTSYKAYDMENLFKEEGGIVVIPKSISKSGKNERKDCNKILEKATEEIFEKYLAYLEEKHNYFTKTKMILFGGGTGEIYFKLFEKVAADYPNVTAKLVTYTMNGEEVTPREAISAGGYKMLLNRLD